MRKKLNSIKIWMRLDIKMIQIFGWIGLLLLHGSNLPQIYKTIKTKEVKGISMSLWIIVFLGLTSYLIYSILRGDVVYIVSNILGLTGTGFQIILILKYKKNGTKR